MTMPRQNADLNAGVYATPAEFIEAAKKRFHVREFAFDFAASRENAKACRYFTEKNDALSKHWWNDYVPRGQWGWLNPPYNNIRPWALRCAKMQQCGGRIMLLVPASVGSNWFRDYVWPYAHVHFLNGRIPFLPDKPNWLYPKDLILAVYSPEIARPVMPTIWDWRS